MSRHHMCQQLTSRCVRHLNLLTYLHSSTLQTYRALILLRLRRYINHLLTYLLTYLLNWTEHKLTTESYNCCVSKFLFASCALTHNTYLYATCKRRVVKVLTTNVTEHRYSKLTTESYNVSFCRLVRLPSILFILSESTLELRFIHNSSWTVARSTQR